MVLYKLYTQVGRYCISVLSVKPPNYANTLMYLCSLYMTTYSLIRHLNALDRDNEHAVADWQSL